MLCSMGGGSYTLSFYLASGPLSIRVVEGVVEVLGFPVRVGSTIVIPLGRSVSVKVSGSLSASDPSKLKPLDASVYKRLRLDCGGAFCLREDPPGRAYGFW